MNLGSCTLEASRMLANGMAIAPLVTIGLLLLRKVRSSKGTDGLQPERELQNHQLEAVEEKKLQLKANEAVVNIAQHGVQVEGTIRTLPNSWLQYGAT